MSVDQAEYVVGELNAPTTTNKHGKRNLLSPLRRVKQMFAIIWLLRLDAIGLQEVGIVTRVVFRLHPGWFYLPAAPNAVTARNRKGSALGLKRKRFHVIGRKAIKVPYRQAFRRNLKQPRVLTRDPDTEQRTLWIVPHPPRRSEPAAQRTVLAHVAAACQKAIEANIAVVVLIDSNNLPLANATLSAVGMRLVENADVQAIFVSDNVRVLERGVQTEGVADVITDHKGLPWAKIELKRDVNTTAVRIPT